MAIATAQHSGSQINAELVAAVAGKRVLITRVLYSGTDTGRLTLKSRLGEETPTTILGWLRIDSYAPHDLFFGREYGVTTKIGEALVFTNSMDGLDKDFQLTVWYELVP